MNELIWMAVPGGIKDEDGTRVAHLHLLIMPRLESASLADAGMAEWPPAGLVGATLAVDFASAPGAPVVTRQLRPPHLRTQAGIWQRFFGVDTPLRSARRPVSTRATVIVDPTSQHATRVKHTFEACAKAPLLLGSAAELSPAVQQQLMDNWNDDEVRPASPAPTDAPEAAEVPDFHRILALLREHPTVLRALGLIIDFRLAASDIPPELKAGVLRVRWPDAPAAEVMPEIRSPWSQYSAEFFPGSTANISAGMVTLTDDRAAATSNEPRWEVITVDVDGAAARLRGAARQLALSRDRNTKKPVADAPATLPALRTAGLMLLRRGREDDFIQRRAATDANASRSFDDTVLTADDLMLGYRIDVSTQGAEWFSLQRRTATYTVDETITIGDAALEQEGHVKAHAASRDSAGVVRADEVIARWSGWSLAVPQPTFDGGAARRRAGRNTHLPFDFRWTHSVPPGTLPLLRFGTQYRMRARVADITGGGLTRDDPAADRCTLGLIPYRRYEPVASPDIRPAAAAEPAPLGPGESNTVVVIRSDRGSVADFALGNPNYHVNARRVLAPPLASLALAEQHGKLDRQPADRTFEWLKRAATADGGLPDPAAGGVCAFPQREPRGPRASRADRAWTEDWPDFKPKLLELTEGVPGAPSAMFWTNNDVDGDVLVVRLAKAEQLTIEMSTFLRDRVLNDFAIKEVLPAIATPNAPVNLAQQGRHPMVTPARKVVLIHAVRQPLNVPLGALTATRESGDTFAILQPTTAMFGVDAKSTGQIAVAASWQERNDAEQLRTITATVQTLLVDRDATVLTDTLRHEFGDTRHRVVTYAITAVSRFRGFFDAQESPDAFLRPAELAQPVAILNSVRPAPPVVIATRPAFAWTDDSEGQGDFGMRLHRRLGGHVRIELERPWFLTGDGERLAIIVSTDGLPPMELSAFMTQAGRDPIWDTAEPRRWPTADTFAGAIDEGGVAKLADADEDVNVVSYEPFFDGDSWYVDVALPGLAAESYCPLVQLVVARYQPQSLVDLARKPALDLRLSRMVKTEFVPLLPERTLRITRQGKTFSVVLEGLGPVGPRPNRVDVILEQVPALPGVDVRSINLTSFEGGSTEPPAWQAVPGQIHHTSLGIAVSIEPPAGLGSLRFRVREVELVGTADIAPGPHTATPSELAERIVFTDTMLLSDI